MKSFALAIITTFAAVALAGCNGSPMSTTVDGTALTAAEQTIAVAGMVTISDPAGYRLQALTAWNKSDVTKVTLNLYRHDGTSYVATGITKDVANGALGTAVTLSNLKLATNYKIVVDAYDSANARIDNQAATGAETDCVVLFTTPSVVANAAGDTVNDATMAISFPVKLKNKTFAGQANAANGVAVTNGAIVNATASESF